MEELLDKLTAYDAFVQDENGDIDPSNIQKVYLVKDVKKLLSVPSKVKPLESKTEVSCMGIDLIVKPDLPDGDPYWECGLVHKPVDPKLAQEWYVEGMKKVLKHAKLVAAFIGLEGSLNKPFAFGNSHTDAMIYLMRYLGVTKLKATDFKVSGYVAATAYNSKLYYVDRDLAYEVAKSSGQLRDPMMEPHALLSSDVVNYDRRYWIELDVKATDLIAKETT